MQSISLRRISKGVQGGVMGVALLMERVVFGLTIKY